jgi:hypothetical protein
VHMHWTFYVNYYMYLFWVLIWSHTITIMTLERLYGSAATCSTSNTTPLRPWQWQPWAL